MEDYKLATANASMNADFYMEERTQDMSQSMANMSLEAGDASAVKPQVAATDETKKQLPAAKEVWTMFDTLIFISSSVNIAPNTGGTLGGMQEWG